MVDGKRRRRRLAFTLLRPLRGIILLCGQMLIPSKKCMLPPMRSMGRSNPSIISSWSTSSRNGSPGNCVRPARRSPVCILLLPPPFPPPMPPLAPRPITAAQVPPLAPCHAKATAWSRGRGFGEGRVVALGEGAILSNMPLPALFPHHHSMRPRGSTSSCAPSSSFLSYSFWIVEPCLCLYVTAKTSLLQCGHFVHNTPSPHSPSRTMYIRSNV